MLLLLLSLEAGNGDALERARARSLCFPLLPLERLSGLLVGLDLGLAAQPLGRSERHTPFATTSLLFFAPANQRLLSPIGFALCPMQILNARKGLQIGTANTFSHTHTHE